MTNNTDFTAMIKDMMASFPMDTKIMEKQFKNQAELAEKLSHVAFDAAQKSTELTTKWTKETLGKMAEVSKVKEGPAEYVKSATDFATSSSQASSEQLAAFAEIAKKVQTQTLELLMGAGQNASEEMTKAANKVSADIKKVANVGK